MTRCSTCSCNYRPIDGDGPFPCRLFFIGERPGVIDNRRQMVCCGPAGEEFNATYLWGLAKVDRADVRFENAVLCHTDNNRTPSPKEIMACASHHLPRKLELAQPEVVVLLGSSACKIADQPIQLERQHGFPQWNSVLGGAWEGWVWPMYHPARALHDTSNMIQLLEDFEHLGLWLKGEWEPPTAYADGAEDVDYQLVPVSGLTRLEIAALAGSTPAIDTETHGKENWSVQYSVRPGHGRMILANNLKGIKDLDSAISQLEIILHNGPQDLDTLDLMGLRPAGYRDTMQEAYHWSGNLPQGLKPLAYRLFGVQMRSWEDVVRPASIRKMTDWLEDALSVSERDLQTVVRKQLKTKVSVKRTPGAVEGALRHILKHSAKPVAEGDKPYDPWEKLEVLWAEGFRKKKPEGWEREYIETQVGLAPILGIGNVELNEAVRYGCADADWTGQVEGKLQELRDRAHEPGERLWVDYEDRD